MVTGLSKEDWDLLLLRISQGECTPFLGAGATSEVLPLSRSIAREWAKQYGYPLEDPHDLLRVAQFLAVEHDGVFPKQILLQQFRASATPDFASLDEPHSVLARLPLPVFLTTNYDSFMTQALLHQGRTPCRETSRWNRDLQDRLVSRPSVFQTSFEPTVDNPVVFHLHGSDENADSLVLTEDDYFDFLLEFSRDPNNEGGILPSRIQRAITASSLLFIGYSINDWSFRILHRSLGSYLSRSLRRAHVSVQMAPGKNDKQRRRAEQYLTRYFGGLDIRVYWGDCKEFSRVLLQRWNDFNAG